MTPFTKDDVLSYIKEHDVRFIRLSFCDIFGQLKNITIPPSVLQDAFEEGLGFDASAIRGFMNIEDGNLLLFPDPTTLETLPWRQSESGSVIRLYSEILNPYMKNFEGDTRNLLKDYLKKAEKKGYDIQGSAEVEFYLFRNNDEGFPSLIPMDKAGYLDIAPLDKGENIRRSIIVNLEEMDIGIISSHHEKGPGQNEISFRSTDILSSADQIISFKAMVKTIANRAGLFASFLPKPLFEEPGSGLHLTLSVRKDGVSSETLKENVAAGILSHIREMQVFLNPVENSYRRLGLFDAPSDISYGDGNRSQLLRVPQNDKKWKIEVRLPDPSCNPYLAYLLLTGAAFDGIDKNMKLKTDYGTLSTNLLEAVNEAENSSFVKKLIPPPLLDAFLNAKKEDFRRSSEEPKRDEFVRDLEFLVT